MTQSYLTNDDVQNYGPELVDFSMRAAAHAVGGQLDALGAQNAALEQQLAYERRQRLDMAVEQAIPNYREIDLLPEWHSWLASIHPLTGTPRQHLLNEAIAAGNTNRVIAFFREFQREHGGHARSQTYGRAPRTRAGAAPAAGGILTRQEIKELYENRRKGRYTDEQWSQIEPQIIAAAAQGRVPGALEPRGR